MENLSSLYYVCILIAAAFIAIKVVALVFMIFVSKRG